MVFELEDPVCDLPGELSGGFGMRAGFPRRKPGSGGLLREILEAHRTPVIRRAAVRAPPTNILLAVANS